MKTRYTNKFFILVLLVFHNYRTKIVFKFHIKIDQAVKIKVFSIQLIMNCLFWSICYTYWFIIGTVFYSQNMALYPWIEHKTNHSLSILFFINLNLCFCHQFDMSWDIFAWQGISFNTMFFFSPNSMRHLMRISTLSK